MWFTHTKQRGTLFSYLDGTGKAVAEGQQIWNVMVLLTIGVVAFEMTLIFFQIRKLTVGAWPWQRGGVQEKKKNE